MLITGELKVHKSDGVTREATRAEVLPDGSLAVWDANEGLEKGPDIIVRPDLWERIEREGHNWKHTSSAALEQRAKRRDDVDEDDINL